MALSAAAFVVLAAASWAYILSGDSGIGDLVSAKGWSAAAGFVGDLAGRSSAGTPAFLRWSEWVEAAALAYRTLAMSVLAIVAAGAGVMLTFLPAAGGSARTTRPRPGIRCGAFSTMSSVPSSS